MNLNCTYDNKPGHILLDCDGVLLDYVDSLTKFCLKIGLNPGAGGPQTYNMCGWLGVEQQELIDIITEFNDRDPEFGNILPYEHALSGVALLKEAGWRMSVITSATDYPDRQKMRASNLYRYFGGNTFDSIHVLPMGADKLEALQRFEPAYWVEDNYKNALTGLETGHTPIMIKQQYNREEERESHPDVLWSGGLDELAKSLLSVDITMNGHSDSVLISASN